MSDIFQDIGDWKALEINGLGVIVQGDTGLAFVPDAKIEDGKLVADFELPPASPAVRKPGPSTIASVNIKSFLAQMTGKDGYAAKNLTSGGEYGPIGPYLARLKEVVQNLEPESPLESALGAFLASGDHIRHGMAAAVLALKPEMLEELTKVLSNPEPDIVENFVDRCITAA
jgi:hypothetical protein